MEKECFKCGATKDISFFYKHSKMADGYLGKCKECAKSDVKLNYMDKIDKYKKYEQIRNQGQGRKEYNSRKTKEYAEKNKDSVQKAKKIWIDRNIGKRMCNTAIGNNLRSGLIKKGICQICKTDKRIQAHHYSYNNPLNVVWLCEKHHSKIHWWIRWNKREYKLKQKL